MKRIEDYLHLYLGCECITEDKKIGRLCDIGSDYANEMILLTVRYSDDSDDWDVFNDDPKDVTRIKLLLRPLSDMTEEEKNESGFGTTNKHDAHKFTITTHFETMRYLLSKGFDLFSLIESGLAIDKTKIFHHSNIRHE